VSYSPSPMSVRCVQVRIGLPRVWFDTSVLHSLSFFLLCEEKTTFDRNGNSLGKGGKGREEKMKEEDRCNSDM
jgi:hypothetical protein